MTAGHTAPNQENKMTFENAHNIVRIANATLATRAHAQATMTAAELAADVEINQAIDAAFPETAAAIVTAQAVLLGN